MNPILEKDLRAWLRFVWNNGRKTAPLNWIEPAAGSSIGFPDVLLPIAPCLIPVELKIAKQTKNGRFVSIVRPVQCRFHLTMKMHNFFSCFLIGIGTIKSFEVWLSHNSFPFAEHNDCVGEVLIASNQTTNNTITKDDFIQSIQALMQKHKQALTFKDQ